MRTDVKVLTKKVGHIFEQIVDLDNLRLAYNKAAKGKRGQKRVQRIAADLDNYLLEIQQSLVNHTFTTAPYHTKIVYEPKRRTIYVLPFYPDRIVQHALMNIMEPYFERWFFDHSLACRKGKGIHMGSRMTMHYVKHNAYCLKGDFSKFYPSVNHVILKSMLRHKIKDPDVLWLLDDIIDSIEGSTNVPIGNYVSQWFGNFYLNCFDTYCYEVLKVRSYVRYCDDFVIFSNNKEELKVYRDKLMAFVHDEIAMCFSKLDLFPVTRGVDFLGYRHFPEKILLRKSTAIRIKRRLCLLRTRLLCHTVSRERAIGVLASTKGWLKHAYTFNLCKSLGIKSLETLVANYEKV